MIFLGSREPSAFAQNARRGRRVLPRAPVIHVRRVEIRLEHIDSPAMVGTEAAARVLSASMISRTTRRGGTACDGRHRLCFPIVSAASLFPVVDSVHKEYSRESVPSLLEKSKHPEGTVAVLISAGISCDHEEGISGAYGRHARLRSAENPLYFPSVLGTTRTKGDFQDWST